MAKQKREQEQPVEPAEKLNRRGCADKVVKQWLASNNGDTTLDELSEKADKLFLAGHPDAESNEEMAAWSVQAVLESLEALGVVALTWHCGVHPNVRMPNGNGK